MVGNGTIKVCVFTDAIVFEVLLLNDEEDGDFEDDEDEDAGDREEELNKEGKEEDVLGVEVGIYRVTCNSKV